MKMQTTAPVESIVWSRCAALPEVDFLAVENTSRMWQIYHRTYTVCCLNHFERGPGLSEWRYRGKTRRTREGTLMFMEPGETHRTEQLSAACSFDVLWIDEALINRLAAEAGCSRPIHLRDCTSEDPELFALFARIHAARVRDETMLLQQSLVVRSIEQLLRQSGEMRLEPAPRAPSAALQRARDYLHAHDVEKVGLAELADISGLSRFHFLRAFASEFGLSPHAYQISLRVEKARALLRLGTPLNEIEVGFADQSHLTRHFRKIIGATPARYAEMVGARRRR